MPGILRLLERPFGPYPEDEILSDKFSKGKILTLTSLYMTCDGSPIGFDETEFIAAPPQTNKITRTPTYFYGILEVESLDWLSLQGRDWIQADLRKRDLTVHPKLRESGLTLSRLYGYTNQEGSRIKVWIQGVKNMSAQFLNESHPRSLIIFSKNKCGRIYNVISLDVDLFQRSQNFLTRYRLWALIETIIETDLRKTPLRKRTVSWLVDEYRNRFRRRQQSRRLFQVTTDLESGNSSRRKFLRHVPRAELFGIFAAHADWLLAQQLAPGTRNMEKVKITRWIAFCKRIAAIRLKASRRNVSWGLPYGGTIHEPLDLSRFGETKQFWENKIKNALKKSRKLKSKTRLRRQLSPANDNKPVESRRQARQQPEFIYDSDFSEASTTVISDSSDREYSQPQQLNISILRSLKPTIASGRFVWECPDCGSVINFLELSEENTKGLSLHIAQAILNMSWSTLKEEWVQTVFFKLVQAHYATHSS